MHSFFSGDKICVIQNKHIYEHIKMTMDTVMKGKQKVSYVYH